jgi:hypothetical protein
MTRRRPLLLVALTVLLLEALSGVGAASATPPGVTVCGNGDPSEPESIQDTTINGDVLVDGWCSIEQGTVVNGNVKGGHGSSLQIGHFAVVNGNVTLNGGNLYFGGASDLPMWDFPATVTGNLEVMNSTGTGPFGVEGIFMAWGEVGGNVTLKNIPHFGIIGACKPPEHTGCGPNPGDESYYNIGGNVSIKNVRGGNSGLRLYTIGGNLSLKNIRGAGQLTGNNVAGDLSCKHVRDLDTWTIEENTVGGTDTCAT